MGSRSEGSQKCGLFYCLTDVEINSTLTDTLDMTEEAPPEKESRLERWARLIHEPEKLMKTICDNVSDGGSVIELAKTWELPYSLVINWVQTDKPRSDQYVVALRNRTEWVKERLLKELRSMGLVDIRGLFDSEGNVKKPEEWPDDVAAAVAGLEVFEEFQGHGEDREYVGRTKKVRLSDKTKAIEMMMKNLAMLIERVDHSGKVTHTLADLVAESNKPAPVDGEKKETESD